MGLAAEFRRLILERLREDPRVEWEDVTSVARRVTQLVEVEGMEHGPALDTALGEIYGNRAQEPKR